MIFRQDSAVLRRFIPSSSALHSKELFFYYSFCCSFIILFASLSGWRSVQINRVVLTATCTCAAGRLTDAARLELKQSPSSLQS